MEGEEWIRRSVEVVAACGRAPFDEGAYVAAVRQGYLPPSSFAYLQRHWVSRNCIEVAARHFEGAAEEVGASLGNLGGVWAARAGFALAFLRLKHAFEYKWIELPGDVKEYLRSALAGPLDLDAVAGSIWPALLSYGTPALRALKYLRIEVGPRTAAKLATPLAVFGAVSDILHPPGELGPTGFGTFLRNLLDEVVLSNRFFVAVSASTVSSLAAALRAQELLLEPSTPSEWLRVAKQASRRYEELGGVPRLYTPLEAKSDLVHFLLAAADHYERGGEELQSLLRRMFVAAGPDEVKRQVFRFIAMVVR